MEPKKPSTSYKSVSFLEWMVGITLVLATPVVTFIVCAIFKSIPFTEIPTYVSDQFYTARGNLAILGVVGLFPMLIMAIVLWIVQKLTKGSIAGDYLFYSGLIAIIMIIGWANGSYWLAYLPNRNFLGWPHGIELFIGPVVFAPIGMLICILVAWAAGHISSKR